MGVALTAVDLPARSPHQSLSVSRAKPAYAQAHQRTGTGKARHRPRKTSLRPATLKSSAASPPSATAKRDPDYPESAKHFQGMGGAQRAPRTPAMSRSAAAPAAKSTVTSLRPGTRPRLDPSFA